MKIDDGYGYMIDCGYCEHFGGNCTDLHCCLWSADETENKWTPSEDYLDGLKECKNCAHGQDGSLLCRQCKRYQFLDDNWEDAEEEA